MTRLHEAEIVRMELAFDHPQKRDGIAGPEINRGVVPVVRRRVQHILEHGVLVSEAVVKHKKTLSNESGGAQKRAVRFEFEFDGETRTATTKISDPYPDLTERYWDGDLPVKLLVDPLNPDTVLWVEGAVFASC